MLAALTAITIAPPAQAGPFVTARGAVIMDALTGDVLWAKDADESFPPASTTKVLTAIVALESGRLDDSLMVSDFASETAPSKINLRPGQRMRLRNLLYAVLLNSANDAAVVVAEGVGGSQTAFAARMNEKANAIGARSSHFVNPHGLTAPGHVSSAYDLALMFRYGLRMPLFREILETRSVIVPFDGSGYQTVALHSHNRLLTGYAYPVIGKTGYTRPARRCFVGAATHDNREIVIALLGASDLWGDAKRMFTWGFGVAAEHPHEVIAAGVIPLPHVLTEPAAVPPPSEEASAESAREEAASLFAVQLGPYATRSAAQVTRARLARRGYTAMLAGRSLRLGSFSNESRARRLASRLRLTGYRPVVVALR
jgi:D-alanyl-D-alanine carboxypeptidase (penicillin-binding protein 5/6)